MVYVRKRKKNIFFRVLVLTLAAAVLLGTATRAINKKLDEFIIDLASTGLKNHITKIINEAVAQSMDEGSYGDIVNVTYDSGGRVRSMTVDSIAVNLLRADVSGRVSAKLDEVEKFYVSVDLSNVFDDEVLFGGVSYALKVDVLPTGGLETDVKSEFISAGINQTNYRLNLTVDASVTADVISTFTVDISTSVNIVDMLIVGDVPTVVWN